MGMAQVPQDSWNETSDPPRQAEFVAALKESNRLVEISFAEVEIPETARRGHEAVRLVHRLCNLYPFFSPDDSLGELSTRRGGGEGAAASLDSAVEIARYPETVSHEGGDPTQPALIADLFGENLAFAKVIEDSPGLSERKE